MHIPTPIATSIRRTFLFAKACIRVASVVNEPIFQGLFKKHALTLLEAVSLQETTRASSELVFLSYLIELAHEANVIHPDNVATLAKECDEIQKEIQMNQSNLGYGSGTKQEMVRPIVLETEVKSHDNHIQETGAIAPDPIVKKEDGNVRGEEEETDPAGSDKRQTAILAKIKELGNCRLKDLMELLPDVSERTIRYDVQKLADKGSIERVGGGGPFSFYRMKTP